MNKKANIYIKFIGAVLVLFLAYHFVVWHTLTKFFFELDGAIKVGDLARLSYDIDSTHYRKREDTLPYRHVSFSRSTSSEILVIGDSFSNGSGDGKNRYFQDYLSTKYQKPVINLRSLPQGFIETILSLEKNGIFQDHGVKHVILQSAQKEILRRFSKKINWDKVIEKEYIYQYLLKPSSSKKKTYSFINNLNYNSLLYNILFEFDDNALYSRVYKAKINKRLFSVGSNDTLLFLDSDLENVLKYSESNVALVNYNLNKLSDILAKSNIKLYFLPSVDKYDLYSKFIINKNYGTNTFFDEFRELPKRYEFIDSKKILESMLENGIQDLYYADDTHWSYKASREIVKNINTLP